MSKSLTNNCGTKAVVDSKHQDMVDIARYIEANVDTKVTLSNLGQRFRLSPTYIQKTFSAVFGLSPKGFQDGIRQQQFKSLLKEGQSVTDALYASGYSSSSRVYEKSSSQLGMTPGVYKAGGQGEQLSYVCNKTQFGYLLIAASDKGVCFAMFNEREATLIQMFNEEFPNAECVCSEGGEQIDVWYAEIEQYLLAKRALPTIPLDLRGTAFQLNVWKFLQSIPEGEVVSYSDVAQGIGKPKAFRAAASACAKNRVALLVPCHRVLRGDGSVGGYRWGVEMKSALLDMEKASQ